MREKAGRNGRNGASPHAARGAGRQSGFRDRLPLALFLAALLIVAIGGGSNRTDATSLVYVRPILVVIIAFMALLVQQRDLSPLRWPLALGGMGLLVVVVQLIPLPPSLWMALPGHEIASGAAKAAGVAQPWRPLSLTPDLTLQSALWFLAPTSAVFGWACLTERDRRTGILAVLALCVVSAVLGGLQASGGMLYLYQRTYEGNAVGFLANRNHQGALLALAFPLLRSVTFLPVRSPGIARARILAAGVAALALVPMVLLTASRAGIVLSILGIIIAWAMAPWGTAGHSSKVARAMPLIMAGALVTCGVLVAVAGRALSLSRLFGSNVEDDLRVRYAPLTADLMRHYFPGGSGAGSFDAVFRIAEPDGILKPTFFNHAHNDFLEVVLTTGLPGLILILIGIGWWLIRGWNLWRRRLTDHKSNGVNALEMAGWSAMLILMLASIVDYPLRTPLLGFVFAVAACWTAGSRSALQNGSAALNSKKDPLSSRATS